MVLEAHEGNEDKIERTEVKGREVEKTSWVLRPSLCTVCRELRATKEKCDRMSGDLDPLGSVC